MPQRDERLLLRYGQLRGVGVPGGGGWGIGMIVTLKMAWGQLRMREAAVEPPSKAMGIIGMLDSRLWRNRFSCSRNLLFGSWILGW